MHDVFSLKQAFVDADVEHTGCVSRSVFHKIINEHGFRISDHHLNQIWNTLPQNVYGTMQYNKFLTMYSDNRDATRQHHYGPDTPPEKPRKSQVRNYYYLAKVM